MSSRDVTGRVRKRVWDGSLPLEIRLHKADCLKYDDSEPYLVSLEIFHLKTQTLKPNVNI
jgi:hypothetical protein